MHLGCTALRPLIGLVLLCGSAVAGGCGSRSPSQSTSRQVGPVDGEATVVTTGQAVRPAGDQLLHAGRPLDLTLSADGRRLFVKDIGGLGIVDPNSWSILQRLPMSNDGGSMHGILATPDGQRVYVSGSKTSLWEATRGTDGSFVWSRQITLPGPEGGNAHALGLAITPDGAILCVCLSRNNTLGLVDLAAGELIAEIETGICPFDVVVTPDGRTAYVSNFGGPRPRPSQPTAESTGSQVAVDSRGIAAAGTLSRIDLAGRKQAGQIAVGLHPSDLELSRDGSRLYVANANSDTVSVIDTANDRVLESISIVPDPRLTFGSICNALVLSPDQRTLFVANGGNNAVAVIRMDSAPLPRSAVCGFLPTAWFPGALATDGTRLFVANLKGDGSRIPAPSDNKPIERGFNSRRTRGSLSRIDLSSFSPATDDPQMRQFTAQVLRDARVPQALRAAELSSADVPPRPVPVRLGEPSVFEHIVYVIKENRTYDQVFGDIRRGRSDPSLCIYGRDVSPNHHALAEQFVLLDNYYCNGIVSADGHQWATQGIVTDYQEKLFGGHTRSYDFGTDVLTYASSNFLWDSVLLAGLSFRNYGEFDFPQVLPPSATWYDVYRDYISGGRQISFTQEVDIEALRRYTAPDFPGWEMKISDAYRMDRFMDEFREFERRGEWPNLIIVYLPQDHTSGTKEDAPTPRAHVADNDLALGRLVEAISHSRFWPKTCIFVNEDDPQDGWDHVDGHRSICLVISPYTRRRAVVSEFYNQTSVLHTITRMFGLPPLNQQVAQAPTMEKCFTRRPNFTPYRCLPVAISLDEPNPRAATLPAAQRALAEQSAAMYLARPDRIDDDAFNRILWHAAKGVDVPYPAHVAGAHGRGLRKLGLTLDDSAVEEDD